MTRKIDKQGDADARTEEAPEPEPVVRPPRRRFGFRAGPDAEGLENIVIIDRRDGGDRVRPL